jgi:hypothetical protein
MIEKCIEPVAWRRIDTPKSVITEDKIIANGWDLDGLFYEALVPLDNVIELESENAKLRAFAQEIMESWPAGDLGGWEIQDAAVKHGLLVPVPRHTPCAESCYCAEYANQNDWGDGVVCYRETSLLSGDSERAYKEQAEMLVKMHGILNKVANMLFDARRELSLAIELKDEYADVVKHTKRVTKKSNKT